MERPSCGRFARMTGTMILCRDVMLTKHCGVIEANPRSQISLQDSSRLVIVEESSGIDVMTRLMGLFSYEQLDPLANRESTYRKSPRYHCEYDGAENQRNVKNFGLYIHEVGCRSS